MMAVSRMIAMMMGHVHAKLVGVVQSKLRLYFFFIIVIRFNINMIRCNTCDESQNYQLVDGYNNINGQSQRQCVKKLCSSNNQSYKCQNNGTCAPDDESSDKGSKCICQVILIL